MVSLADAPSVADGIAAGKQDRFVFCFSFGECFFALGVPVNRVMGMLEEIKAGFVNQAVESLGVMN
jgi:hypothetical protein